MTRCLVALPALLAVALVSTHAHAQNSAQRLSYQNGGNACTGALPTYEGALRKRPTAIANQGSDFAFVTCSAEGDYLRSTTPTTVVIRVTNRNANSVDLSCTFINGDAQYGTIFIPQTKSLLPGIDVQMAWNPVPPAANFEKHTVSVSCALPPNVELNSFANKFSESIGQ